MSADTTHGSAVEKLLVDARKGSVPAVVFFVGSEDFLLRHALTDYLELIATPDVRDFDFTLLRGEQVDGNTLYNALTTLPFVSSHRVVVLEDALKLGDATAERLTKYLNSPAPTTRLVLVQTTESGGRAPALPAGKLLTLRFDGLRDAERIAWASDYCKRHGKSMSRDAAQYLVESSTGELTDLAAKLDLAMLYIGVEAEITSATLMRVSGITSEYTIFQLEDAVLRNQVGEACRIAKSLLDGGIPLLGLLGYQRRMLIKLWQIGYAERKYKGAELDAARNRVMGRQAWKIQEFSKRARGLSDAAFRRAVTGLLEIEILAKNRSGESGATARFFEWLYETCRPAGSTSEPKFRNRSILLSA